MSREFFLKQTREIGAAFLLNKPGEIILKAALLLDMAFLMIGSMEKLGEPKIGLLKESMMLLQSMQQYLFKHMTEEQQQTMQEAFSLLNELAQSESSKMGLDLIDVFGMLELKS